MAAKRKRLYPRTLRRLTEGIPTKDLPNRHSAEEQPIKAPGPMPMVRPGLRVSPKKHADIPVEATAKRAFLAENPDGSRGFQIEIKDELFDKLRCSIDLRGSGQVEATFYVQDDNLRRLLEAESPRLRSQLEMRGLKVSSIKVAVISGE